jgi:hypothetical protein
MRRTLLFLCACGARTALDIPEHNDAQVQADGLLLSDAPAACAPSTIVSDVFGGVVDFASGAVLPAGHYTVTYVDGCMKYAPSQGWTVNAYGAIGPDGYWLVTGPARDKVIMPPGTVGYAIGSGAFASFDDCVHASHAVPPVEFDFAGGSIGVWLEDSPYGDNVAGQGGRNPTWHLSCE